MSSVRDDRDRRCVAIPTGGCTRSTGGAFRANTIWRLEGRRPVKTAQREFENQRNSETLKMGAAAQPLPAIETPEHPRPPRRVKARKLFETELVRAALKQ